MENNAVIEFFADQLLDALDMIGARSSRNAILTVPLLSSINICDSLLLVFAHAETEPKTTMAAKRKILSNA